MNKIFKKVWNRRRGCFVAVSEAMTTAGQSAGKAAVLISGAVLTGFATPAMAVYENIPANTVVSSAVDYAEQNYRLNLHGNVTVTETGTFILSVRDGAPFNIVPDAPVITNNGETLFQSWRCENCGFYNWAKNAVFDNRKDLYLGKYPEISSKGRSTEGFHPESFNIIDNASIKNTGRIFSNTTVSIQGNGSIQNSGTWLNENIVNHNSGSVTGSGVVRIQGTYNLNGGTFQNKLTGDGTFNYNGGNFNASQVSGNVTVNIASGLNASSENFAGGKINNHGTLAVNRGWFNSLNNWGTANFSGDASFKNTVNYGNLNSWGTVTFTDNLRNSGNFNSHSGKWQYADGGHLSMTSGTITTANHQNIFDSLGSSTQQAMNYVSLNSSLPQEVKVSLNDFFLNYVPGQIAQTLVNHASFAGGKVIVTGVNLTQTQADDLTKVFKDKFFLQSSNVSTSAVEGRC